MIHFPPLFGLEDDQKQAISNQKPIRYFGQEETLIPRFFLYSEQKKVQIEFEAEKGEWLWR